jgi:hypothetical protein
VPPDQLQRDVDFFEGFYFKTFCSLLKAKIADDFLRKNRKQKVNADSFNDAAIGVEFRNAS